MLLLLLLLLLMMMMMMMMMVMPTSARVIPLKEVGDWFPVAANAYHDVTVDSSHEVRFLSLQFVSKLHNTNSPSHHIHAAP